MRIDQQNTLSQEQSSWYRASTLAERLSALKARRTTVPFPHGDQARKRLQRWQEQSIFKDGFAFLERLELDGITEEDLLTLLEPSVVIPLLTSAGWTTELVQAFAAPPTPQDEALLPKPGEEERSMSPFLKPVEPLLRQARARLYSGIERLERQYTICPFHTPAVLSSLFASLSVQFRNLLTRTLVLEMHMYRVQQRLQGETPEQRFASFVDLLCHGQISTLLEEYPVLARQLVTTVEHWVTYGLEFLDHLCADWAELRARFSPETDPGPLMRIHVGAGDAHRGGRTVLLLQFRHGLQLVYKPKSLAIDVHFQELLSWLNACGYSPPLATMKIVDRGSYGWTEYVAPHDCSSEADVQRFYQRQGGYLALLYALQALDFHAENVIAAGEHPFLIDLEALFHPNESVPRGAEHPAASVLRHSVLRVGLLPYRIHASDTDEGIDISGLGGWGKQRSPLPVSMWEESGTDRMHLTRKHMELKAYQNLPRLNGQDIALLDYKEALLTGFTTMYRLLMKQREVFVTDYLPRFWMMRHV
ncbi:hypothetical protein KDH_08580 [Dictyobacter sp. S3.2.2.5]|uniref:Lantibiotic biosynthesis protein dehydration domain-containing protein n=1 Tax=Dictyobacter halimunensis TaxID=3026934 RepID=A0ABQ6FIQ9_9CHLR|nr:hypothetical protein KDH_08580 [Dictyobacter sp. S3.2.2.5]